MLNIIDSLTTKVKAAQSVLDNFIDETGQKPRPKQKINYS